MLFHTAWGANWSDPDTYVARRARARLEVVAVAGRVRCCRYGQRHLELWSGAAGGSRRPFEVPQTLNVRHGVFIVENLDTSALAADGVREFALVLTHPKLRGATGAWMSPIALV